jgi:hypothetical protein
MGRRLEVGAQSLISWLSMPVQVFAAQLNMTVRFIIGSQKFNK